jgi:hypothetical protein
LVDGSLQVTGDQYDSTRVYFQSDRLDQPYVNYPGGWPGIYFRGASSNNNLRFAVIRNAYQAVSVEGPSLNANPKLILNQCIIDNSLNTGILGTQSSIQASNCLISNCGQKIGVSGGGVYQFVNCTVAGFSNELIAHTQPVLSVNNYIVQGSSPVPADLQAGFINCIFWGDYGNVTNEVQVSQQGNTLFSVNFSNCLWKVATSPSGVDTSAIIANMDPLFDSVDVVHQFYNFRLQAGSPAISQGVNTGLPFDLDGNPRPAGPTDLGCYQRQ